ASVEPLAGVLVVDLTRYLPGPFASRELLRLGARVVRLEPPAGDPLREIEPAWDALLNAGKESVVCDLKHEPEPGRARCALAGALSAVGEIVAALVARERTGRGASLTVSFTWFAHRLAPFGGPLTGRLASYRMCGTADGRWLTVASLEPRFFARLCDVVGRPDLAARHRDPDQESLAAELEEVFAARPLAAWLELLDGEE